MCNTKFGRCFMKGWALEQIYESLGTTKDIHSILEMDYVKQEGLLRRILGDWSPDEGFDAMQDDWNKHLAADKKICWRDLYDADVATRAPNQEQEEEPRLGPDLEPQEGVVDLAQFLKELEDRLIEKMTEGFEKVNTVTTNLEDQVKRLESEVSYLRSEVRCQTFEEQEETRKRSEEEKEKEKEKEQRQEKTRFGYEENEGFVGDQQEENDGFAGDHVIDMEFQHEKEDPQRNLQKEAANEQQDDVLEDGNPDQSMVVFKCLVSVPPVVLEVEEEKDGEKDEEERNGEKGI